MPKVALDLVNFQFPFSTKLRAMATILPGLDQDPKGPSPFWVENVMPITNGIASVGKSEHLPKDALPIGLIDLDIPEDAEVYTVLNPGGASTYLMYYNGKILTFNRDGTVWVEQVNIGDTAFQLSVFYLKGITYVFHKELGLKTLDTNFALVDAVMVGLVAGDLRYVTAAVSYMICVTDSAVIWSSPNNPLWFTPNTTGNNDGAGSTSVLTLRGNIQTCLPTPKGFNIYTDQNIVVGRFSGNSKNPWIFTESPNSSGVFSNKHVTFKSNLPVHYVWTDMGIAEVGPQGTELVFPELTEFISGNIIERYNVLTNTLDQEKNVQLSVTLNFVNNRFLTVSYGIDRTIKEFILLYDILLKRWGKITIRHRAVFNLTTPKSDFTMDSYDADLFDSYTIDPRRYIDVLPSLAAGNFTSGSLGIMAEDGSLQKMDWVEWSDQGGDGRVIVGGITLTRERLTTLNTVKVAGELDLSILSIQTRSVDLQPAWADLTYFALGKKFLGSKTGKEHELKLEGGFALSALEIKLVNNGVE